MKKSNILIAVFSVTAAALSAGAETGQAAYPQNPLPLQNCCGQMVPAGTCMMVCINDPLSMQDEDGTAAGPGVIENLTETSAKMSYIDMDKNPGEAGKILDGFYTGSKAKGDSGSSAVYAEPGNSQKVSGQAEKEICNAKPSKIVLAGKVPPLKDSPDKSSAPGGAPLGSGFLAAGAVALGFAGWKKGYFSNYGEDAHTVWDFVTGGSSNNDNPPHDEPPSSTPSDPYAVHPSGAAVVCVGSNCGLP